MTLDDRHGPKHGCNYQRCGRTDLAIADCPFTKDRPVKIPAIGGDIPVGNVSSHHHDYALVCSCGDIKRITTSKGQHDIIAPDNRGQRPFD